MVGFLYKDDILTTLLPLKKKTVGLFGTDHLEWEPERKQGSDGTLENVKGTASRDYFSYFFPMFMTVGISKLVSRMVFF